MPEPIRIEDVRRLDVRSGDKLIVRVPAKASHDQAAGLAEQFRSYFDGTVQVVIVAGDVEVSVVREESTLAELAAKVAEVLMRAGVPGA